MSVVYRGARELAHEIASGRLSACDALEAHVQQLRARNPELNAVVTLDLDRARNLATRADEALRAGEVWGPLHGVPMTIKDTFDTAGMVTTVGMPQLSRSVPKRSGTVVERLQRAGAVIFGKTNVPLASYDWQCNHPHFGRTNNPWDLDRTPGGSSGGSAAAVAAGISPLEYGSDVGGSIRIPASFCGVFGLRPTEGLVSGVGHANVPGAPRAMRNLVAVGPLATNVADLRLALEATVGRDERDLSVPPRSVLEGQAAQKMRSSKRLRIFWTDRLGDVRPSTETSTTLSRWVDALSNAGHHVEPRSAPVDLDHAFSVWGTMQGFEMRAAAPAILRWPPLHLLSPAGFALRFGMSRFASSVSKGYTSSPRGYFEAWTARDRICELVDHFLRECDLWICPTSPTVAFGHQPSGSPIHIDGHAVPYGDAFGVYSCPIVTFGVPVVSAPVGLTSSMMPVGVQCITRRWHDLPLLEAVSLLENEGLVKFERPPGVVT